MKKWIITGSALIVTGILMFAYYNSSLLPNREAKELLTEGKMIYERGSKQSINRAIDIFTKIIAKYPDSKSAFDSYYLIAQSYEKLNLNRLAYLKYIYILKNNDRLSEKLTKEIKARIARLKILKRYDEEGIHYLLTALNYSEDRDFRSRVYTELGHTYLKKGLYRKSLRMFDLSMKENGKNEEAVIGKARAYKRLGLDSKAYDLYDHFLRYYGNFSYYADDISRSYNRQIYSSGLNNYRKGKYYPAISFFRKYLKRFPGGASSENALYWIGESYFSLKKYNQAVKYFKKVMSNGHYHKDQDAYIKTGYAYFMAKNYELASRQFQEYLEDYPNGKYRSKAAEWKRMSNKELLYKFKSDSENESGNKTDSSSIENERYNSGTVHAKYSLDNNEEAENKANVKDRGDELLNVAEL